MDYEWSSDLETGYKNIDEQHKQLFESMNDMLRACRRGAHRDEVVKIADFLVNYTMQHFADEEELQLKHHYPAYTQHKRLHNNFRAVVSGLAGRLAQEGPTLDLITEVYFTIGRWLDSHIKGEDLKIALHVKGRVSG